MPLSHRDRVATALAREEPDRCPMQISFTPEFADRLRADMVDRGLLRFQQRLLEAGEGGLELV